MCSVRVCMCMYMCVCMCVYIYIMYRHTFMFMCVEIISTGLIMISINIDHSFPMLSSWITFNSILKG